MLTERGASLPAFDTAALDAGWEAAKAEQQYWEAHYAEYLQRFPDRFVAVKAGQVIATNPDLYDLVRDLGSKGLAPTETWMRFITADPARLLR
jgi:hypothetical protein